MEKPGWVDTVDICHQCRGSSIQDIQVWLINVYHIYHQSWQSFSYIISPHFHHFPSEHDGHCHFGGYAWKCLECQGRIWWFFEKSPSNPGIGDLEKTKVFTSSILLVQILLSFLLIKPLNPLKCPKIISVITMLNLFNLCLLLVETP